MYSAVVFFGVAGVGRGVLVVVVPVGLLLVGGRGFGKLYAAHHR